MPKQRTQKNLRTKKGHEPSTTKLCVCVCPCLYKIHDHFIRFLWCAAIDGVIILWIAHKCPSLFFHFFPSFSFSLALCACVMYESVLIGWMPKKPSSRRHTEMFMSIVCGSFLSLSSFIMSMWSSPPPLLLPPLVQIVHSSSCVHILHTIHVNCHECGHRNCKYVLISFLLLVCIRKCPNTENKIKNKNKYHII